MPPFGALRATSVRRAPVCRRLGLETIYRFRPIRDGRTAAEPSDSLDLLIRLFLYAEPVERTVLRALLPVADLDLLETFGLVTTDPADPGAYRSTSLLYPTGSLYVASDRSPEAGPPPEDMVYSAISDSTRRFLTGVPWTPCESFLELCAGSGIAALGAARQAGHAWATDISARATHFARFNGLLNQLENFTAVRGDLFDAVAGRTFDRIAAHPPYMPALEQECLYQDGGRDGEQITHRIVAGLPAYLREGGRFYCYCMTSDRQDSTAEARLRESLGDAAGEFDVALVALDRLRPADYYSQLLSSSHVTVTEAEAHLSLLERLRVRQLLFCWVAIQRARRARRVFTVRRLSGKATAHEEIDWLLDRETAVAERESDEWLLDARPRPSAQAQLHVAHQLGPDGWTPTERSLKTEAPFLLSAKCPAWAAQFVTDCDGSVTVGEYLIEAEGQRGDPGADDRGSLSGLGRPAPGGRLHLCRRARAATSAISRSRSARR